MNGFVHVPVHCKSNGGIDFTAEFAVESHSDGCCHLRSHLAAALLYCRFLVLTGPAEGNAQKCEKPPQYNESGEYHRNGYYCEYQTVWVVVSELLAAGCLAFLAVDRHWRRVKSTFDRLPDLLADVVGHSRRGLAARKGGGYRQ